MKRDIANRVIKKRDDPSDLETFNIFLNIFFPKRFTIGAIECPYSGECP